MSGKVHLVKITLFLVCLVVFRDLWLTYPDVLAISQGQLLHPTLISTVSDANLVYEFLSSGLLIDDDNNVGLQDEEIASMRKGRIFLSLINDDIPKTVSAMEELLVLLEDEDQIFDQDRFQTLFLGIIYSAYQASEKKQESQKQSWADVLGRLANVTLVHIRRS